MPAVLKRSRDPCSGLQHMLAPLNHELWLRMRPFPHAGSHQTAGSLPQTFQFRSWSSNRSSTPAAAPLQRWTGRLRGCSSFGRRMTGRTTWRSFGCLMQSGGCRAPLAWPHRWQQGCTTTSLMPNMARWACAAAIPGRWQTTRPMPFSEDTDLTLLPSIECPCPLCRDALPRVVQSWARNYIFCVALYCIVGSLWAYYIYACYGARLFGMGNMPAWPDMVEQIKVCPCCQPLEQATCGYSAWQRRLHVCASMCSAQLTAILCGRLTDPPSAPIFLLAHSAGLINRLAAPLIVHSVQASGGPWLHSLPKAHACVCSSAGVFVGHLRVCSVPHPILLYSPKSYIMHVPQLVNSRSSSH